MNRRSPARVLTALMLAAGIALGTAGAAGALSPDADPPSGGTPGGSPADAAGVAGGPATAAGIGAVGAIPCPVGDPDPKVTNPGTGIPTPCVPAEGPAPAPDGDPPAEQPAPPVEQPAPPVEQAGPHAAAPTAALRTLATALTTTTTGVSVLVKAPKGLDVGPVEISVLFGTERRTQNYDRATGNFLSYRFPHLDGAIRAENLSISLLERGPAGPRHYGITSIVTIEPRFSITVSRLLGEAEEGCDTLPGPNPTVFWVDQHGVQRRIDVGDTYGPGFNSMEVLQFSVNVPRVGVNDGLTMPAIEWRERDPFGGSIGEPALARGPQLLPRPESPQGPVDTVVPVRLNLKEIDGDCNALFEYTIRYHPVV